MRRAFGYCVLCYFSAFGIALAVGAALRGEHPLWVALAADLAATLVVFGFSVGFDNSSLYDPYWSVAPLPLGVYFALQAEPAASDVRTVLVLGLVALWGARLTYNFLRGWQGLAHEDWRYVDLRRSTGRAYWLVSLLGIHVFPTLIVFAGCLPLYAALARGSRPLGVLDAIAAAVTLLAIAIETAADEQLRRFRLRKDRRPEEILDSGLWARSRHPNYLGEMSFWWGLWLFALAASADSSWTVLGPLAVTSLFCVVSVRLLDKRMLQRRPRYAERMRNVPAFVPYRWW
ncbi:MAG TPA: DUF1295 domain-containing protein [Polyangiales bacterium]|nr:DUF1295 domain-containing protein [Polyangiales bacterium]